MVIAPLSGHNDGSGGAYHYGCDFASGGVLYLDATFANTTVNPLNLEVALYVAELSEAFMGAQNRGWGCGFSNGEALSRFLAEQETPDGTLNAFVTAPAWHRAGRPDWVYTTEQTDRNAISTGCGMVYIYWMRSLGYTIPQIVQAGGATLAANYTALTGKTTAFQDMIAGLTGYAVNSDNPFDGRAAAVGGNSDGRLEVFGVGMDRALWHIWQQAHMPGHGRHGPRSAAKSRVTQSSPTTPMAGWKYSHAGQTEDCGTCGRRRHMPGLGQAGLRSAG